MNSGRSDIRDMLKNPAASSLAGETPKWSAKVIFTMFSEYTLVRPRDESFERKDFNLIDIYQIRSQTATNIKGSQLPTLATEYEIGLIIDALANGVRQADNFERNFLLSCAGHLLPFE